MPPKRIFALNEILDIHERIKATVWPVQDRSSCLEFKTFIRDISEDQILIDVPYVDEVKQYIRFGSPIRLEFMREDQQIPRIDSNIFKLFRSEDYFGCWVPVPVVFEDYFVKRRRHVRISVKFPIKGACVRDGQGFEFAGQTVNISGGGLRFISFESFQLGEVVKLVFKPDAFPYEFRLEGEIVACSPSPFNRNRKRTEFASAVRFVNLNPHQEDRLVGLCFRLELEQKKHLQDS